MLVVENLTKTFGDTRAVDNISLRIEAGEMVAVIGRSGAGKSTFLRMINRLVEPNVGRILSEGEDVLHYRGRELRQWRAQTAMIFQQFNLVNRLDVLTNVLIGRVIKHNLLDTMFKRFTEDERANAVHILNRLGLLDQALQRTETLSGGQQQRVAIAKALMQKPKIILADEPVASLDPHNSTQVMDTLRMINREDGLTVLCNLHTLDIARNYCTRIVGLSAGRIVFDGPPEMLNDAALEKIYGATGLSDDDKPNTLQLAA